MGRVNLQHTGFIRMLHIYVHENKLTMTRVWQLKVGANQGMVRSYHSTRIIYIVLRWRHSIWDPILDEDDLKVALDMWSRASLSETKTALLNLLGEPLACQENYL